MERTDERLLLDDMQLALAMLTEWHIWCDKYRPNLGAPRVAPYCRQSKTSRQYDEDAAYDRLYIKRMQLIDFCVSSLSMGMQQSIGCEIKNRRVKAAVWRSPSGIPFATAIGALMPVLRKNGLLTGKVDLME